MEQQYEPYILDQSLICAVSEIEFTKCSCYNGKYDKAHQKYNSWYNTIIHSLRENTVEGNAQMLRNAYLMPLDKRQRKSTNRYV